MEEAEEAEQEEFKFSELSARAQELARDRFRENHLDYDWWQHVYSDAVTAGHTLGIELWDRYQRTTGGVKHETPDISFSGFCSQGDGAQFTGQLWISSLPLAVDKVKAFAPEDEVLAALAVRAQAIHDELSKLYVLMRLDDQVKEDGHFIELDARLGIINGQRDSFHTGVNLDEYNAPPAIDALLDGYVRDFASWIYKQLEAEHDHLMSDESIDEAMENYDTTYWADGSIFQ